MQRVRLEKLDFIALQETKLEVVSATLCRKIWGSDQFGFSFLPSIGNNGGILSIWNSQKEKLLFSFIDRGFVGVCLEWEGCSKRRFVVNIYSQGGFVERRHLYEVPRMSKGGFGKGLWCMVGDFNVVRSPSERRGSSGFPREYGSVLMRDFNRFINDMFLNDLPLLGQKFTWIRPNGSTLSRLDGFLVSKSWLDHWGVPSQWALIRDVSDHCPIVLRYPVQNLGPKPFKFKNFWLLHKDFNEVIENCLLEASIHGWAGFVLFEKMKLLKHSLKKWSAEVFGGMDSKIE